MDHKQNITTTPRNIRNVDPKAHAPNKLDKRDCRQKKLSFPQPVVRHDSSQISTG